MIPILYEGNETAFTSNGLGRLADAISCKVVEERNATYELEMTYPISGVHYDDLAENRIILAKPFDGGTPQPFIIYKITRPLNGKVTVNAEHISYRLSGYTVMPFTATSCVSALAGLKSNSAVENPFTFATDKTTTGNFSVTVPTNARELLCGSQGSILDVYGKGDYEFSFFNVKLWQNRGADNHVTLRYGKNITDLKSVLDMTGVYTGIVPYWTDGGTQVKTLPEKAVLSDYAASFPFIILKPVDFSQRWDNEPTDATMRTAAQNYLSSNEGWKLKNNITVSFVALWGTEEYKDIAPLERVKMCDVVKVVYSKLGIDFSTRVVKTDYNVLQERYNAITLGDTYYSLSQVFNEEIQNSQQEQMTYFQKAIAHGTALITGGLGGYVYLKPNANGQPEEILIMDKPDIAQSVRMIRMNKNGIGFSDNGYNGPFNTAWTIENNTGHFYAEYIDAGTFNANLIQAGKIQPIVNGVASANYWDMLTGDFHLSSTVAVDNSTIASIQNINSKIGDYDTTLDQQKVFNRLTNNGAAQGITLNSQTGNLYINATYIKSGALEVGGNSGMVGSITLKDASNNVMGTWNKNGMTMYDGSGTAEANITGKWNEDGIDVKKGKVAGTTITGSTIQGNTITGGSISGTSISGGTVSGTTITGSTIQGDTISGGSVSGATISGGTISGTTITASTISGNTVSGGTLSGATITGSTINGDTITGGTISGTDISGGTLSGSTITGSTISGDTITGGSISGTDVSGGTISGSTITGATVQSASTGRRILMDSSATLKGMNGDTLENYIDMMQPSSNQMNIFAIDTLNIMADSLAVGEDTSSVTKTVKNSSFKRVNEIRKVYLGTPGNRDPYNTDPAQPGVDNPLGLAEGWVAMYSDNTLASVADKCYCTLPVILVIQGTDTSLKHGMVVTNNSYTPIINT